MRKSHIRLVMLSVCLFITNSILAVSVNENVAVNGKQCDVITWTDDRGQSREIALVRADGDTGNYIGGYIERYRYQGAGGLKTAQSDNSMAGVSGLGTTVHHYSNTAATGKRGSNGNSGFILQSTHHVIWRWTANVNAGGNIATVVDYIIRDGRSDIGWASSYDTSSENANTVQADCRGPYVQFDWDGDGAFFGTQVSGIRWGDRFHFRTVNFNGAASSWDYTQANSIPYMMLYKSGNNGDAECGMVQTQTWTQQDAGGYWWANSAGGTSSSDWTAGDTNNDGAADNQMPANWNCPFQLNAYEGYNAEKMAWGTNFGYVGRDTYQDLTYANRSGGHPHQGYTVFIHIGQHSHGGVDALIQHMASSQQSTLSATQGQVVSSGPDHVGLNPSVTYQPQGWDHRYAEWVLSDQGSGIAMQLNVGGNGLSRSTFRIENFSGNAVPATIQLNNQDITLDQDYHASLHNNTLYVTLLNNLAAGVNNIAIANNGQNPPPPPPPVQNTLPFYNDTTPTLTAGWWDSPSGSDSFVEVDDGDAAEGSKKMLATYTITNWWQGLAIPINNWNPVDISAYDNLHISLKGPSSGNVTLKLVNTANGVTVGVSAGQALATNAEWTDFVIPLATLSANGFDISATQLIRFDLSGVENAADVTLMVDNIYVSAAAQNPNVRSIKLSINDSNGPVDFFADITPNDDVAEVQNDQSVLFEELALLTDYTINLSPLGNN